MAKNSLSLADLSRQRKKAIRDHEQLPATPNSSQDETLAQEISGEISESIQPDTPTLNTDASDTPNSSAKRQDEITERSPLETTPTQAETLTTSKKAGRPKSLRSNRDYESTTIFLHRNTKAKARYYLSTQEPKQDLQILINDLLLNWVEEQVKNNDNI